MIIGITGKYASGKSTALNYFKKWGAFVIDADKIGHNLYDEIEKGGMEKLRKKLKKHFGKAIFNKEGQVNRTKLAHVVFNNQKKLRILNQMMQPLITHEIKKIITKAKKDLIVIEAFEFSPRYLGTLTEKIILIDTKSEIIKKRLYGSKRYQLSIIDKLHVIQKTPEKADFIINNNFSKNKLNRRLVQIMKVLDGNFEC